MSTVFCANCGKSGHETSVCYSLCTTCGYAGHVESECRTKICEQCGRYGHLAETCKTSPCIRCGHYRCYDEACVKPAGALDHTEEQAKTVGLALELLGPDSNVGKTIRMATLEIADARAEGDTVKEQNAQARLNAAERTIDAVRNFTNSIQPDLLCEIPQSHLSNAMDVEK